MALVAANLESALLSVISGFPATAELAATGLANAYHTYAATGQSCAGLVPTVVNLVGLQDALKTTLEDDSQDASAAAEAWKDGLVMYWTGGLFGPTGTVLLPISGAPAFEGALESFFSTNAEAEPAVPFATAAGSLAGILDTFTRTVQVTDAASPCGPLPIT